MLAFLIVWLCSKEQYNIDTVFYFVGPKHLTAHLKYTSRKRQINMETALHNALLYT